MVVFGIDNEDDNDYHKEMREWWKNGNYHFIEAAKGYIEVDDKDEERSDWPLIDFQNLKPVLAVCAMSTLE